MAMSPSLVFDFPNVRALEVRNSLMTTVDTDCIIRRKNSCNTRVFADVILGEDIGRHLVTTFMRPCLDQEHLIQEHANQ